jgi:hypothetical protein
MIMAIGTVHTVYSEEEKLGATATAKGSQPCFRVKDFSIEWNGRIERSSLWGEQ